MTATQNEKLVAAAKALYDIYKAKPVEERTSEEQAYIENYEAEQDDTEETFQSVVEAGEDTDEPKAEAFEPTTVEANPDLMALHIEKLEVQAKQGLKFKDPKYANFFSLKTTASAVSKQASCKVSLEIKTKNVKDKDGALQNNFGAYVADMLGLHCFSHINSRAVVNKAVKEQQLRKPYATVCAMHLETSRNTAVDGQENIKQGNVLVIHADAPKYEHDDKHHIVRFKDILLSEVVPTENEPLTEQSHEVLGLRYQMTKWHSTNKTKVGELIEQIHTIRPESIHEETFKAWSGVLAIALMTSQDLYNEMWQLMLDQCATHNIPKKVKLAAALSIVVPKYITFLETAGVPKDKHLVNSGLLRQLLSTTGYEIAEMSKAFEDHNLAMKDNKAGLPLEALQATYAKLPTDDNFKTYFQTLKK
ncbi:hypothetical protein ACT43X_18610 (plasmid) [Acinetobacter baumannii]